MTISVVRGVLGANTTLMASFGEVLKEIREDRNMTQEELGERSGLTHVAISDWERGRRSPRKKSVELVVRSLSATREEKFRLYQSAGFATVNASPSTGEVVSAMIDDLPDAGQEFVMRQVQSAIALFHSVQSTQNETDEQKQ